MDIHPSIFLFAISAAFTPGPNNIMIMTSGLNFGMRASLPHFFGICFGFPTMFLAMGFGLGLVFESYPLLHQVIKVLGILYLIWLSWLIANSAPINQGPLSNSVAASNSGPASNQKSVGKPLSFVRAALFQWVNPKAWIMSSSAIAAYTTSDVDIGIQIIQIALVFFLLTFPSAASWLFFGRVLKRIINKPKQQKAFNIVMALLLLLSVLPIVLGMIVGNYK